MFSSLLLLRMCSSAAMASASSSGMSSPRWYTSVAARRSISRSSVTCELTNIFTCSSLDVTRSTMKPFKTMYFKNMMSFSRK